MPSFARLLKIRTLDTPVMAAFGEPIVESRLAALKAEQERLERELMVERFQQGHVAEASKGTALKLPGSRPTSAQRNRPSSANPASRKADILTVQAPNTLKSGP